MDVFMFESVNLETCCSDLCLNLPQGGPLAFILLSHPFLWAQGESLAKCVSIVSFLVSTKHQELIDDIETIQRLKTVYDKFQMAIVDINVLPFDVKFVPFIEYRAVGGKTYLHYKDAYDFKQFKNFMDVFR